MTFHESYRIYEKCDMNFHVKSDLRTEFLSQVFCIINLLRTDYTTQFLRHFYTGNLTFVQNSTVGKV